MFDLSAFRTGLGNVEGFAFLRQWFDQRLNRAERPADHVQRWHNHEPYHEALGDLRAVDVYEGPRAACSQQEKRGAMAKTS